MIGGSDDFGQSSYLIGVIFMNRPPQNRQGHIGGPSLWVDEPAGDALPLLEGALREDEPSLWVDEYTDDVHSPLEENARPRGFLVRRSDLIRRNVVPVR
jgi:hypothetical protein